MAAGHALLGRTTEPDQDDDPAPAAPTDPPIPEAEPSAPAEPWLRSEDLPAPPPSVGSFRAGDAERRKRALAAMLGDDDLDPTVRQLVEGRLGLPRTARRR